MAIKDDRNLPRRFAALALALTMSLGAALPALAEGSMNDGLFSSMAEDAARYVELGDVDMNIYQHSRKVDAYAQMPRSFDLRDDGYVPPVANQGNWGTCWGFASIGASEISILAELNMSAEQYLETYGEEMNLSEKHLAWFGTSHLPELTEGETYVYPTLEAQAGEGIWLRDEETDGQAAHYNNGGLMAYVSGLFAAGMGLNLESDYPYAAANGTSSTAEDWTLEDSDRFILTFELENSSILPNPSQRDEEGNYVYSETGTLAIKDEIPVDGTMLDFVSANYLYAGYHRIQLNHDFAVPAGSRISVVQQQRAVTADNETVYVVPYSVGTNKKYMEAINLFDIPVDYQTKSWAEGRIGQGESFVFLDGGWADWADVIDELQNTSKATTYLSYDNMNIKLYAYPIDEVKALHELSDPISFNDVQIQICGDCGYTLIEQ